MDEVWLAAATALMQFYDNGTERWQATGRWNSANALTAILDYSTRTDSRNHRHAIATTFDRNRGDNFTNDTGWWAPAWIRAYDLTKERRYLDTAVIAANYMYSYRDGGLWWSTAKTYKNAVTNAVQGARGLGLVPEQRHDHRRGPGQRRPGLLVRRQTGRPCGATTKASSSTTTALLHEDGVLRDTSLDQHALGRAGPVDRIDAARQHSALEVLTAAL